MIKINLSAPQTSNPTEKKISWTERFAKQTRNERNHCQANALKYFFPFAVVWDETRASTCADMCFQGTRENSSCVSFLSAGNESVRVFRSGKIRKSFFGKMSVRDLSNKKLREESNATPKISDVRFVLFFMSLRRIRTWLTFTIFKKIEKLAN